MEYNPNMFQCYEKSQEPSVGTKINSKLLKQYGKFERKNVETGSVDRNSALAVFLVASFLETKNKKLLKEAKGLDDVVQVSSLSWYTLLRMYLKHAHFFFVSEINVHLISVCTWN